MIQVQPTNVFHNAVAWEYPKFLVKMEKLKMKVMQLNQKGQEAKVIRRLSLADQHYKRHLAQMGRKKTATPSCLCMG